jgi:hypothetical protein
VVWWSVDHAAYAGAAPSARVGRIVAGVPDLFVLFRGIAHMVEIKTPAGELSDPQQLVMAAVLATGISNKGAEPDTVIGTLTDSPVLLQPSSKMA